MPAAEQVSQPTQVHMAMLIWGLMTANQVAGKASRDAIFLSEFRTSDLPAMVTVAAIVAVAASIMGSRMLVRLGPHRMAPLSLALSAALQVGEWLLMGYRPGIAACAIYLHTVALGAVLLSGFWSLMNESFEPRAAKQLFGRISGMGALGGVFGGLLAERVATWFGTPQVLLLLAMLHLMCAGLVWRAFSSKAAALHEGRGTNHVHETTVVDAVHRYPFLLVMTGVVITASSGTALLDFVFKAQAAQTIGHGAPLLRFFGLYYTGASLLTFLIQTFLTRFFVQHAGLAVSAGTLPVTITLGSLMGMLLPGFPVMIAVRTAETVVRGSLYRSAYELFYTAVAAPDARAVKSLIDVGIERAADAVGSAGVTLMLVLAPGRYGPILALSGCFSMVALWLSARLQPGYLHALEKSLTERAIELDPSLIEDSVTQSVLMQSIRMPVAPFPTQSAEHRPSLPVSNDSFLLRAAELRSGDASRVVRTAAELGPDDWLLAPLLLELLAWDEVMPAARDALKRIGQNVTGMLVDALLDAERDFVVKRRVPRVLVDFASTRCVEGLFAALEDQRFEVRFYAARALQVMLKDHPGLSVAPERVWTAVNRELSLQRSVWDSHRLLDSRAVQEREWFFDDQLLDSADRNLEHLFTLLALLLPVDAVRVAFRALHTDDRQLKGTAVEYLESATPAETRRLLLPMLETDPREPKRAATSHALENS